MEACPAEAGASFEFVEKARLRPLGYGEAAFATMEACPAEAGASFEFVEKARLRPLGYGEAAFATMEACPAEAGASFEFVEKARLRPLGYGEAAFATMEACPAEAGAACEGWWSQAGSNRRPRHCERRALPAELWPRRDRLGMIRSDRQSAPFTVRPKAKSRTVKASILASFCRELPLFAGVRTDI
jgi:hypothetical protein